MNPIIDHYTHQGVSSKNPNRSICLDNFYKRLPAAKILMLERYSGVKIVLTVVIGILVNASFLGWICKLEQKHPQVRHFYLLCLRQGTAYVELLSLS